MPRKPAKLSLKAQLEAAERKGREEGYAEGRKKGMDDVLAALAEADPEELSDEDWSEDESQDEGRFSFHGLLQASMKIAVEEDQLDVLLSLVKAANIDDTSDKHLSIALYWAIKARNIEMVQALLKAGADPNLPYNRLKPLSVALNDWNSPSEIVIALLAAGADVSNSDGNSYCLATTYSNMDGDPVELTRALIEAKAYIGPNRNGSTPLMSAAENGMAKSAALLIEAGCDVNAINDRGWTALMKTVAEYKKGTLGTIKLLLNSGAEVNYKNKYGHTALIVAARAGHSENVRLLLSAGADVFHRAQRVPASFLQSAVKAGNAYDLAEDEAVKEILKTEMHRRIAAVLSVLHPAMPVEVRQKIIQSYLEQGDPTTSTETDTAD